LVGAHYARAKESASESFQRQAGAGCRSIINLECNSDRRLLAETARLARTLKTAGVNGWPGSA
jgi:hypothetical protein